MGGALVCTRKRRLNALLSAGVVVHGGMPADERQLSEASEAGPPCHLDGPQPCAHRAENNKLSQRGSVSGTRRWRGGGKQHAAMAGQGHCRRGGGSGASHKSRRSGGHAGARHQPSRHLHRAWTPRRCKQMFGMLGLIRHAPSRSGGLLEALTCRDSPAVSHGAALRQDLQAEGIEHCYSLAVNSTI